MIFFDTEFIENGKTIELISIGLVKDTGEQLYLENADIDLTNVDEWIKLNVVPYLTGPRLPLESLKHYVLNFCGKNPEFMAYYGAYDWVLLNQTLFGKLINQPKDWHMWYYDFKQMDRNFISTIKNENKHNALSDAIWLKDSYFEFIKKQNREFEYR